MATITEQIYSNDFMDYILPYSTSAVTSTYAAYGAQLLDSHYFQIHDSRTAPTFPVQNFYELYDEYLFMPKLLTPLSTVSLEASGILQAQTQPYLTLNGRGTILGFIDSGIDYTHKTFLTSDGRSRILTIWDQTIPETNSPDLPASTQTINPYQYGTIFTNAEINQALQSNTPYSIVPSSDETGHGTALAGIAAGTPSLEDDFTGVAYEAELCMVKLKPAKQYLRDYYFAQERAVLYQENDVMMGIRFLIDYAQKEGKPLIICLGLGTNQGDHAGNSPLSKMITDCSYDTYTIFSIGSGNEGNKAHHYYHYFPNTSGYTDNMTLSSNNSSNAQNDVEILVPAASSGFVAELWGSTNALFSIGFQSPLGTVIAPITASPGRNEIISFVLEKTKIQMTYSIVAESGSDQLIFFRFENPIEGNWIIRVYNRSMGDASFHIWLPSAELLDPDITFLKPSPDTTLTVPSDADSSITTGFYNAYTGGMTAETGRGFTRENQIKPNIIAPGVNITAPVRGNRFQPFSGSSAACAILAGGIAQLQQWRMDAEIPNITNANSINAYLVRGAIRSSDINYPNQISGYGQLDIYHIFESLMS